MTIHSKGVVLTMLGVLLLTPDTLLLRLIGMDVFTTAFWRGIFQSIGVFILVVAFYRGRTIEAFRAIGFAGFLVAFFFAATTLTFVGAVKNTSVANALVLLASTPFHAAVFSRIFLGESIPRRTWIAIFVGMFGVAIIVSDGVGGGTLLGDGLALLTAVMLAAKFTIVRSRRDINMIPAVVLSSALYATAAFVLGGPPVIPNDTQLMWLLILGFVVITPATALMTLGPRYISAPEVSLIVLLETVLGPLWVWIVIGEEPTRMALIGGTIVVSTLVVHSLVGLRAQRRANRRAIAEAT